MTRAEMRRVARETSKKTKTYNLTEEQIRIIKQEATTTAVNEAMILLLTLPLEVLMDHYWQKTYDKKIPEFTNYVLEYYEMWQNGELDMDKLKQDLWEFGGVKLERSE